MTTTRAWLSMLPRCVRDLVHYWLQMGSAKVWNDRTLNMPAQIIAVEAVLNFEHGAAARHEAEVAAGVAGVGAVQLTESNFDSEIAGKSAFIKFLAPW